MSPLMDVSVKEDNLESTDTLVDALFAGPPHRFIPGRDDLAKRLVNAGREADAAEVKKLSKPPVSVWLVNQWARRQPALLDRLLTALDHQRQGEHGAVDHEQVLQARSSERAIVEAFEAVGADILSEAGVLTSRATVDRAMKTLRMAAAYPATRTALTAGRLTEELGETSLSGTLARPSTDLVTAPVTAEDHGPPRASPPTTAAKTVGPESEKTLTLDTVDTPRFVGGPLAAEPTRKTGVGASPSSAGQASKRSPPPIPTDDDPSMVRALRRDEVAALAVQLADIEAEASIRAESLADAERQLESIRVRLDEAREVVFRRRRRR